MVSLVKSYRGCTAARNYPFFFLFKSLLSHFSDGCSRFLNAAVKVQKSNNLHWDSGSNYCHPPHGSHSKTWSSPSHPHNQQDHCKCKLSLMTAPLLARHGGGRSLFFSLPSCTFVQSFSEITSTLSPPLYLAPSAQRARACATDRLLSKWLMCHASSALLPWLCEPFDTCKLYVSFQLWWVVASPLPPQPPQASAAKAATLCPVPSLPWLQPAPAAPPARGGTGRRTTRAHVWKKAISDHVLLLFPEEEGVGLMREGGGAFSYWSFSILSWS